MEEKLENLRKKALRKQLTGIIVVIVISILLIPLIQMFSFFLLVLGIIICSMISNKDVKAFNDSFKQEVALKALNEVCTDVTFDVNKGIDRSVIANTHMMNMGDIYRSNDYVTGKYKNISFELSDVEIEEESTDSDGDTTYYTVFKGQWFIFDFNKTFKANVQVCEKGFGNNIRGYLFSKKEERYKRVELEDIEFNKKFKVYAQNELDAFYILTPGTMNKIKEIKNHIKGSLLLCFIDNKLHIGLYNNKDLFEASIYKKVNIDAMTSKTKDEISAITNFVDILSLDNDLFKF